MSAKRTFIYRVEMGKFPEVKEIAFCYARNKDYAVDNMKVIFKDRHYDMFRAYKLGETDYIRHPGPFEVLPKDEEEFLRRTKSTVGEEYAERRRNIPRILEDSDLDGERGVPVQGENTESVQAEGERIPDPAE